MPVPPVGVPSNLVEVLEHLASDGLVAFPTETVWGLAARAESRIAVERLRAFKGRTEEQPISILIDGPRTLGRFGVSPTPLLSAVVEAFWPGPLTLVATAAADARFASGIVGPAGAVGFRCSDHPLAALLVREALGRGLGPLTATSFNRGGETPVRTHSQAVLLAKSDASHAVIVLHCGAQDAFAQAPSTVLDLAGPEPRVLRWGAVPQEALAPLLDRFR
ncbi:MAG: L-threonylcarbamoyladenylate synthase [Deltaproteobacteria bacterium]|nr:L-threonylcarbamoyladenylate synthase [Deltaproteobacteria bacterium]